MRDEQAAHEEFEQLVGGPERGFRLMRLYESARQSASGNRFTLQKMPSAEEIFRKRAKQDGYTDKQITAFLNLP